VITFNEIWASQRHERLQTCGLCKNLIFMNLVKEKLRSASYRRYVWWTYIHQ
jgi:Na+-translocating ferredoxin:NAD+ oxidoreductase RnfC subunit